MAQKRDKRAEHWVGTTEAAELLGVVPRTLYRLIDEGSIPAYKLGRVIRLKADDLEAFLESTRVQPGELRHLYPDPKGGDYSDDVG
ncbi:MAG TPA: helix-turn-helix domain-containing protein [Acidimicrobiales bacterium]|nr:helix-turn-helix domain-containing protein [Acidimicrobiales bacterium]